MNTPNEPKSLAAAWAKWVKDALRHAKKTRGLTRNKVAALISSVDGSGLSKLTGGGRELSATEVTEIARATGFPPPVDLVLVDVDIMTDFIPLKTGVAAGIWREESIAVSASPLRVHEFFEPAYAGLKQHARLIEDSHADLYAPKGFYVICVDYNQAKTSLNDGNIVVIERLRPGNGSDHLIESLIKEIARRDGEWFLDSLAINSAQIEPIPYSGDTDTLRIRDLVLAAYRPSPRA